MKEEHEYGRLAYLHDAHNGHYAIQLIEKAGDKWLVRICGSGKEIEVTNLK